MKAWVIDEITEITDNDPLTLIDLPRLEPGDGEVLLQVLCCGVCHTELDEIEGRTAPPELPVVPGHQVVGRVIERGGNVDLAEGERVGVAWIYSACGECEHCEAGNENLCADFQATGRDANGGYAEYMVVPAAFAYPIPDAIDDAQAAPLLCAGAIGYRSLRLTGLQNGQVLGFTGFGASAHLAIRAAKHQFPESLVYVFARSKAQREFAEELGADWTGATEDAPPQKLHALIDTTPVWKPVTEGLKHLAPGGRLVINAIRKESMDTEYLADLDYATQLWEEKEIKSVANVARIDVREFLQVAAEIGIEPEVTEYAFEDANQALRELRSKDNRGAKVLRVHQS